MRNMPGRAVSQPAGAIQAISGVTGGWSGEMPDSDDHGEVDRQDVVAGVAESSDERPGASADFQHPRPGGAP